jgi:hypothetical protein
MGGAIGTTTFEDDRRASDYGFRIDEDDTGGQLFAGMTFNDWLGIEGTIANLGEYKFNDFLRTTNKYSVMAVTAMFRTPAGRGPVSFYGKAGLGIISWEEEDDLGLLDDDSGGALALGFGLILTPRPDSYMSLRFSFDIYSFVVDDFFQNKEYDQAIGMSSIGLQFNF